MDVVRSASLDISLLKEPRGLLRVVQFLLSIFAFATISSVTTKAEIHITCHNSTEQHTLNIEYGYPFRIAGSVPIYMPLCGADKIANTTLLAGNFSASAEFFCFVGVMSFLVTLFVLVVYVMYSALVSKGTKAATADFIFSAIWTVIWFIASVAWADNLNKMGDYMNLDNLKNELGQCGKGVVECQGVREGDHSTLIVSVLFGFLNMGIWGAGLWFLFKETPWHTDKSLPGQTFDQPHATTDTGYQTQEYPSNPGPAGTPSSAVF